MADNYKSTYTKEEADAILKELEGCDYVVENVKKSVRKKSAKSIMRYSSPRSVRAWRRTNSFATTRATFCFYQRKTIPTDVSPR